MSYDLTRPQQTLAVVGAGTMGRGIAQVAAMGNPDLGGGMNVLILDEKPGASAEAKEAIGRVLSQLAEKGRITADVARDTMARITPVEALDSIARADVIVEAIVERLDVKQMLFERLDQLCPPTTILASNTSSIPITAIAARASRPERIGGLHFFNPVPLMRLVEVIPGLKTSKATVDALVALGRRLTREPVVCIDSPGFIVNHAGRAYATECPRILSEGIATAVEIDRIMTGAPGLKLGMFALSDLVGIDVNYAVMESLYAQFHFEPAYAPNPLSALRAVGGMHGQKTGEGWFKYEAGKRLEPPFAPVPNGPKRPLWFMPRDNQPEVLPPFADIMKKAGVEVENGTTASKDAVIALSPIGYTLSEAALALKVDPARAIGVDMLFGPKGPRTLMVSPATAPEIRDAAHQALAADGQQVVVINDSPGFVAQRVIAMVINNGCHIAQRGIASPQDIDKAVKLGLGYPYGPMEWGDLIGPRLVVHILRCLEQFYGEPRYRPSAWLKRRAALGLSLMAPEGKNR
jgi:3-hydroxybutyryl-CoA dehydrogenase